MPPTLLKSHAYTSFVAKRDAALERIAQNTQIDISRILFVLLEQVERLASNLALKTDPNNFTLVQHISKSFEQETSNIFSEAFPLFVKRIENQRKNSFILAYASEMEAVGRATSRKHSVTRGDFANKLRDAIAQPTIEGPLRQRIWHDLMTLRRRIIHAFELGVTQGLNAHELVQKVKDSFPKFQVYKRPPKALTKVRESAQDPEEEKPDWLDLDFIDDGDWNIMVDSYLGTQINPNRFDSQAAWDKDSGLMKYNWELEQETTEDFVKSVRTGQHAGATAMGVQDFVWVAVIDDSTCEDCCLPRNGKTTSEIEQMDDECGVTVPPAHFNCRCQIAPVASRAEVQGPKISDFSDWLAKA